MIFTGVKDEIYIRYSSTLIKLRIQNSLVFSILQQYTTNIVKSYLDFSAVRNLFFFLQKSHQQHYFDIKVMLKNRVLFGIYLLLVNMLPFLLRKN